MAKHKESSFEDALAQLEELTKQLERGSLSLEDSIHAYEEGLKLSKYCAGVLKKAEQKLEAISKNEKGELIVNSFLIDEVELGNVDQNRLFQ